MSNLIPFPRRNQKLCLWTPTAGSFVCVLDEGHGDAPHQMVELPNRVRVRAHCGDQGECGTVTYAYVDPITLLEGAVGVECRVCGRDLDQWDDAIELVADDGQVLDS
jgi:hypothetical protein